MARSPVPRAPEAPKPAPEAGGGKGVIIPFAPFDKETAHRMPQRSHTKDAGLDLHVARNIAVHPGNKAMVSCNIAVAIPAGYYGIVVGRSSTLFTLGLLVNLGIIDAGYRGEVMIVVYNPSKRTVSLFEGDRIAQLLVMPVVPVVFKEEKLERLPEGDRGKEGFGSTGGYTLGDNQTIGNS